MTTFFKVPQSFLPARFYVVLLLCVVVLNVTWHQKYHSVLSGSVFLSSRQTSPAVTLQTDQQHLISSRVPSRVLDVYRISKPSKKVPTPPYSTPNIFAVHTRLRDLNTTKHDMFVYTTGIAMQNSTRKLTVMGCIVGNEVHPARWPFNDNWAPFGVVRCTLSTRPAADARVSLLLLHDAKLREALSDTNRTISIMRVAVPNGTIVDAPKDLKMMLPETEENQRALKEYGVKMVASDVTMDTFPVDPIPLSEVGKGENVRHRVCLSTQIKAYTYILPTWVDYHRALGVDKVFIADNEADQDVAKMFEGRDDVEVLHWPWDRTQHQAFSFLIHAGRSRCEWMILDDVDEFVMLGKGGVGEDRRPLGVYVDVLRKQKARQVMIPYVQLAGQYLEQPKEPLPVAITTLEKSQHEDQGKAMCSMDVEWERHSVHRCIGFGQGRRMTVWSQGPREPTNVTEGARLVHFHYRSWSDYMRKRMMGSAGVLVLGKASRDIYGTSVPDWFYATKGDEWTFFRDRWSEVMSNYSKTMQTAVWTEVRGNATEPQRCVQHRELSKQWVSNITCTEFSLPEPIGVQRR